MSFFKVNHFKPYITDNYGDGICGVTIGKGALCGGRETLFRHLEGINKGHLGIKCHRMLPNIHCWNSHPTSSAPSMGFLPRAQGSTTGGDLGPPPPQRSSYPTIRRHNRIHLHPLSSAKEKWADETSDQSEKVELLGGDSPLQNGGNSYPLGFALPGTLDGESGFEGCLLYHSHPPGPPEILEVHGGWDLLPVHLPTIQPVLCLFGVHQADEAINNPTEV